MEPARHGYPQSLISIFICALPVTLLAIYIYCSYKLNYWKRKGVQQLRNTNKIFGDFKKGILFRIAPGQNLKNIYHDAPPDAPYIGFYIFHKPCLLIRDPEIIKQILIRDFDNFSDRYFAGTQELDSFGMRNLFGLKNPTWRYLRKKITPTLSLGKMKQMLPLMLETGRPMMDSLRSKLGSDAKVQIIDAQDISYKYASDLIANVALGAKTDSFSNPDSDYTKNLMDYFYSLKRMIALVTVFFMPQLVDVIGSSILFDASFASEIFWNAVESREKSGEKRGDYIDSIVQLKNGEQDPVYKLEGDNLLFQSGAFFSGFESSSTASAFTLMELAKHKEYQQRAREEIKSAIDQCGWTIAAFNKMKFLDQCISEAIRLHPPVTALDRDTRQDYKLPNSDVVIEKGTPIYISLYGLHGDPKFFEEPEVFSPERFNDDRSISDAYLPFGAGPRMCLGMKLGKLHAKVVISMILSEFEIHQKRTEENKMDSRSTFTAAARGINVEFTKLI